MSFISHTTGDFRSEMKDVCYTVQHAHMDYFVMHTNKIESKKSENEKRINRLQAKFLRVIMEMIRMINIMILACSSATFCVGKRSDIKENNFDYPSPYSIWSNEIDLYFTIECNSNRCIFLFSILKRNMKTEQNITRETLFCHIGDVITWFANFTCKKSAGNKAVLYEKGISSIFLPKWKYYFIALELDGWI